jgi:glycosyltransferase involved in cell wall biosynthesis
MRLIQPYPDNSSAIQVNPAARIPCPYPVQFVRTRYKHHAAASGYDRLCDYIDAPTVRLPRWLYWAGETLLRPYCLWHARCGGSFEYSRYDCVMESAVIRDAARFQRGIYHFVYAEKSFKRMNPVTVPSGIKLVGTVHHPVEHHSWLFRDMRRFRRFDQLITMDRASVPSWEEITGKPNVKWIPHGVDTEYFHPAEHFKNPGNYRRLVFVGYHERDFKTLSTVINKLIRIGGFHFDLVSRSPELKSLTISVPDVHQHDRISDADYRTLLQRSDLLLLPLRSSTVCNSVLEAIACGLPVVTTGGGIDDYLDPSCSRLVPIGDADAMCQAVQDLIARGEFARVAARKRAFRFSWTEVAKLHVEIYRKLLGETAESLKLRKTA